jgi:hypothetical protein
VSSFSSERVRFLSIWEICVICVPLVLVSEVLLPGFCREREKSEREDGSCLGMRLVRAEKYGVL